MQLDLEALRFDPETLTKPALQADHAALCFAGKLTQNSDGQPAEDSVTTIRNLIAKLDRMKVFYCLILLQSASKKGSFPLEVLHNQYLVQKLPIEKTRLSMYSQENTHARSQQNGPKSLHVIQPV